MPHVPALRLFARSPVAPRLLLTLRPRSTPFAGNPRRRSFVRSFMGFRCMEARLRVRRSTN